MQFCNVYDFVFRIKNETKVGRLSINIGLTSFMATECYTRRFRRFRVMQLLILYFGPDTCTRYTQWLWTGRAYVHIYVAYASVKESRILRSLRGRPYQAYVKKVLILQSGLK